MNARERWRQLCELLFAVAPGLNTVGAYDRSGNVLAAVGSLKTSDPQLRTIQAIGKRIGGSSPLGPSRPETLPRASFTIGGQRLLVRSLAGNHGYIFIFGPPDSVTSNTWLLLDSVAVLGGALQSQSRPDDSQEKS